MKINNKIILKIDNIKIKNSNNKNIKIENITHLISKISKYFVLSINNNNYNLHLENNILKFKNNMLNLELNIYKDFIFIKRLNFKNIDLKNIPIKISANKKSILFSSYINYFNNIFYIKAITENNYIKIALKANNISYKKDKFQLETNDFSSLIKINLKNFDYKIYANTKDLFINRILYIPQLKIESKHNFLYLNSNNGYINYEKQKFQLKNIRIKYNIFNRNILIKIDNLFNKEININKIDSIFTNMKLNIKTKNIKANYKNLLKIEANNSITNFNLKTKDIKSIINNINLYSQDLNLSIPKINIINNLIYIKTANGKLLNYPIKITDLETNISNKIIKISNINTPSLYLFNNIIDLNKKKIIIHSNSLFNKELKSILKHFLNLDINVTQIKGDNNITSVIDFKNEISHHTIINTKKSLIKIFDMNLSTNQGIIDIDNNFLKIDTNRSNLYINKDLNIYFNGKSVFDLNNNIAKFNLNITKFTISTILDIYNEKANLILDLNKNLLIDKKHKLRINFNTNILTISEIKPILKFSPLHHIFKNGFLQVDISKSFITTYLQPKYDFIYKNNKALNTIFFKINLYKDFTNIKNNFVDANITDKIKISINNIDLNAKPIEKIFLLEKNNSNYNSKTIPIEIESKKTNLIYNNHKFLSEYGKLSINKNIKIFSKYKNSSINGYSKHNYFLLEGTNFSKEEITALIGNIKSIKNILIDFTIIKSPENFYKGKIYLKKGIVKGLSSLNNIIAFINTIPSIITFSNPGFTKEGYKITGGYINYIYYDNKIFIKDSIIKGKNIDFKISKGLINLKTNKIKIKLTLKMKMKVNKIPIIGKGISYIFFGKDNSININIIAKGDINNPIIKKDLGEVVKIPIILINRALTLPFNIF